MLANCKSLVFVRFLYVHNTVVCLKCVLRVYIIEWMSRGQAGYVICRGEMTPDKPTDGHPAG